MKLNKKYYILRHGEAVSNVRRVISSWPEKFKNPLTKHGKETILAAAEILKENHAKHGHAIDVIFASPLLRTKQTAQIVAKELNVPLKFDKRLREIGAGSLNGKTLAEWKAYFKEEKRTINNAAPRGETYTQILARMLDFLKEINKECKGKNILIVSHQSPLWILENKVKGFTLSGGMKRSPEELRIEKGQIKELN